MVESNTTKQLSNGMDNLSLEETKDVKQVVLPQKLYMPGTMDQAITYVKEMLSAIDLNALEIGLIERYMKDPETVEKNMTGLLKKILEKHGTTKWKAKMINKVIPLFDGHVFWDTQPVGRFAQYLDTSMYD